MIGVSLLGLLSSVPQPAAAAVMCNGNGPVLARPVPSASTGVNQFAFQIPLSPALTGINHYLLVDDFPETHTVVGISTGLINTVTGVPKSELFWVAANESMVGYQFASCRIRSHMLVNGPGTTPVFLVVKQGATQNDGAAITVTTNFLLEYERVMPLNPITNAPWTGDDLEGGIIIGVKNTAAPGGGVGFADIAMECQ
jgi:hypothetical protein